MPMVRPRTFPTTGLVLALVLAACATPQREKGRLVAVTGLSPEAVAEADRPRRVALLVGVDDFEDPFWPALKWAAKDAHDLASLLADPKVGAFDEVIVLADADNTSRQAVLDAVRRLARKAPRPEDTVVVYVSSHGTLAPTPTSLERVLVLRDTRQQDLLGTGLAVTDLLHAFDALPSKRKALILATCHSGTGKSLLTAEARRRMAGLKGAVPTLEEVSRASLVLSAADFGQPAREDDRLGHDVYTSFFIEALARGADANGDGAVSATEAHDFARRRTFEYTEGRQLPTVESAVAGADPILLAGQVTRPGLPVVYSYAAGLDGYEVRVDGRPKGVLPGNVVVEEGARELVLAHGDREAYRGVVHLAPGERVRAEGLLDALRPHWAAGLRARGFGVLDASLAGGTLRPVAGTAASLRRRDAPLSGVDTLVDVSAAYGRQTVVADGRRIDQDVQVWSLGVGLAYAGDLGPLRLYGGPHLAWLGLGRTLHLPDLDARQDFGTVTPGLALGGAFALGRFELQLEGQAHYLPFVYDGALRSVATVSVAAGVGMRF